MANFHTLDVYHLGQQQLRDIAAVTGEVRFGDLANQLRRSAISVVSNIVEGAGRGSDAEFIRFLCIARASNDELAAQITMLAAITGNDHAAILGRNAMLGRKTSALIAALRRCGY
jgi:four helix bundle protein